MAQIEDQETEGENVKLSPPIRKVFTLGSALIASTALLAAQQKRMQVVSEDSRADLYLGSSSDPKSYSAGTARVSGYVTLNSNEADNAAFNLTLYSANRTPDDPAGTKTPSAGAQPAIRFDSQHVTPRSDGRLEVTGQLAVITVSHRLVVNAGESYSGPEYGAPIVSTASHDAVFVFSPLKAQRSETRGAALFETSQAEPPALIVTATAKVNGESYPELGNSIGNAVWPVLVNDQSCTAPASVGEDFSGPVCSGTIVDSLAPATLPTQSGEDYSGARFVVPAGNQVTVQLHLVLAGPGNAGSAVVEGAGDRGLRQPDAVREGRDW